MSLFRGSLLISVIALGLSAPAVAQPKADAGSGPTKGAVSTDDAGSGPTKGAKPNTDSSADINSNGSKEDRCRRHRGPRVDRRLAARHAGNAREEVETDNPLSPGASWLGALVGLSVVAARDAKPAEPSH